MDGATALWLALCAKNGALASETITATVKGCRIETNPAGYTHTSRTVTVGMGEAFLGLFNGGDYGYLGHVNRVLDAYHLPLVITTGGGNAEHGVPGDGVVRVWDTRINVEGYVVKGHAYERSNRRALWP